MKYQVTSNASYVNFDGKRFNIMGGVPRINLPEFSGELECMKGVYDGPSSTIIANANGSYARQFGIKMRNANTCNLCYVMRVIEPISRIDVSVKYNPGMTTNEQCRDGGYTQAANVMIAQIYPGDEYKLVAKFAEGTNTLMVYYNDEPIWIGNVGAGWTGMGGIRTDNVRTHFEVS